MTTRTRIFIYMYSVRTRIFVCVYYAYVYAPPTGISETSKQRAFVRSDLHTYREVQVYKREGDSRINIIRNIYTRQRPLTYFSRRARARLLSFFVSFSPPLRSILLRRGRLLFQSCLHLAAPRATKVYIYNTRNQVPFETFIQTGGIVT